MTISRTKPGDWTYGDKLTAAEMNALDTNPTYGLDKRATYGDTLASAVVVTGTISLAAGVNVLFAAPRTRIVVFPVWERVLHNSGPSSALMGLFDQATQDYNIDYSISDFGGAGHIAAVNAAKQFVVSLPVFDGSTLTSVSLQYTVPTSHLPEVKIAVRALRGGSVVGLTGWTFAAGTDGPSYQCTERWLVLDTYVSGMMNAAAEATDFYSLVIADESGAGAVAGNKFGLISCTYTAMDIRW